MSHTSRLPCPDRLPPFGFRRPGELSAVADGDAVVDDAVVDDAVVDHDEEGPPESVRWPLLSPPEGSPSPP
ncbi:hypothetical protein GCM10010339_08330 [Streptomyces alanosinicus]|uniref:Uncharacterized protein n=1 Tax=Streptomyces alanosinicus TaxID=68171 RepID=A0A918YD67_9ACTN|nr:hypothetical protein GCM10010339_08330 [Streptomyces alanosinicus]